MIRSFFSRFLSRRKARARAIFSFRVGRKIRYADPVYVHLSLLGHGQYLPRHLTEARAGGMNAIQVCADAACEVFGLTLKPDLPNSVTLADCVRLLFTFDLWRSSLRLQYDPFCRLAAIHGVDVGNVSPEEFCALYFSRNESEVRTAETQRLAIRAATAELPEAWFLATRDTVDEAKAAHDQHVAAIQTANASY